MIDGPAGQLDSRWRGDGEPILFLHPHPLAGGTMGSRFTYDAAQALADSFQTIRFDYRGVRRSGGDHSDGRGETEDALAVWDFIAEHSGKPPIVVGHSFGGGVAVRVASQRPVPRLILVGTPPEVSMSQLRPVDDAGAVTCPVHLIVGTDDEHVSQDEARRLGAAFANPQWHILQGADHFVTPTHIDRAIATLRKALA